MCSERLISAMMNGKLGSPNLAAQKYQRLLAQGMALNQNLFNLSVLSVPEYCRGINGKKYILTNPEIERGVSYSYVPIFLFPILTRIISSFFLFIKIIKWRLVSKYKYNYLVFDILNIGPSITSILISKIFRIKSIAIVTDLPEMMYVLKDKIGITDRIIFNAQNLILWFANGYVVLTEATNLVINKKRKPYCIIEGLADIRLMSNISHSEKIISTKVIHYSGGLYEKFGVKALIDAFMLIDRGDISLHIFGIGDLEEYIVTCIQIDSRIVFFGYKDNSAVIEDQLNSFILINPRFTHEDYTKYSFPSKIIEYMASGIPLLTTKLPGIPPEYLNFVYLFEEENIEGFKKSIQLVLEKPAEELFDFGAKAKEFVLTNKNNKIQAKVFYNHLKKYL